MTAPMSLLPVAPVAVEPTQIDLAQDVVLGAFEALLAEIMPRPATEPLPTPVLSGEFALPLAAAEPGAVESNGTLDVEPVVSAAPVAPVVLGAPVAPDAPVASASPVLAPAPAPAPAPGPASASAPVPASVSAPAPVPMPAEPAPVIGTPRRWRDAPAALRSPKLPVQRPRAEPVRGPKTTTSPDAAPPAPAVIQIAEVVLPFGIAVPQAIVGTVSPRVTVPQPGPAPETPASPTPPPTVRVPMPRPDPIGAPTQPATTPMAETRSPAIRAALLILDSIRSLEAVREAAPSAPAPPAVATPAVTTPAVIAPAVTTPTVAVSTVMVPAVSTPLTPFRHSAIAPSRQQSPAVEDPAVPHHAETPGQVQETAVTDFPARPVAPAPRPAAVAEESVFKRGQVRAESEAPAPQPAPMPAHAALPMVATPAPGYSGETGHGPTLFRDGIPAEAASPRDPPAPMPSPQRVTLELGENAREPMRIRVSVHGSTVRATIVSGAGQAAQLSQHTTELREALEDRGFRTASVAVHAAGAGSAAAPSRADSGFDQPRDGHPDRPDREPRERDRHQAMDDRPRRQRRSHPEEE